MFAREPLSRRTLAVIASTAALFVAVLVLLSAQMASGNDPALSANARRAKALRYHADVDARAAAARAQIEAQVQAEAQAQQQYDENYGNDGYVPPAQDQQPTVQPQDQQSQQQDVQPQPQYQAPQAAQPQYQAPQVQAPQPQPQQQAPLQSTTS